MLIVKICWKHWRIYQWRWKFCRCCVFFILYSFKCRLSLITDSLA